MPLLNDLAGWLGTGLRWAVLGVVFTQHPVGLAFGLTLGLVLGLTSFSDGGPVVARYLMLLIVTRGRLPWRLGRFLRWCHADAGLLRTAGIACQFRHRELQDHLAATSLP
ncbi:hypothetical protein AAH991_25645 [Microbispora sp. ZYX-F-249]|uniref:Uncharacterized protein n=1 Tax=Microbispora maris TaxID=3144104 RepID=A0ABV0AUY2_9ACTN